MEYIESSISEIYAQTLRIINAERLHSTNKRLSVADALILSFDKYDFETPDKKASKAWPDEINSLHDIQYIQHIFDFMLEYKMGKKDVCSAYVKLIHERDDGLCLAYIMDLTTGPAITSKKRLLSYDDCYDIADDPYMPRLCLVDKYMLNESGYFADWDSDGVMEFDFYKRKTNSTKPQYHYFNEYFD